MPSDVVFVDVSGWYAYLDKRDPNHAVAVEKIERAIDQLITSDYVLSYVRQLTCEFVDSVLLSSLIWLFFEERNSQLLRITEDEELQAWKIFRTYNNLQPSFAECTSLVILNKYKIKHLLSFNDWLPHTIEDVKITIEKILTDSEEGYNNPQ